MKDIFIGRNTELEYYQNCLVQDVGQANSGRVFFLKGSRNIGKKAFHSRLESSLLEQQERGWIWVRPVNFTDEKTQEDWVHHLNQHIKTNLSVLQSRLEAFQENITQQKEQEGLEQIWLDELIKQLVKLEDMEEAERPDVRLLFVLDNYDDWEESRKKWFGEKIYAHLKGIEKKIDVRYLMTGRESLLESVDLEHFWNGALNDVIESQLSPLNGDEIREYLVSYNLPENLAEDFEKKSRGVPDLLVGLIKPILEKAEAEGVTGSESSTDLFKNLDEQKQKWLLWSAHLGQITVESLSIYCDISEAEEAHEWLINYDGIKLKKYPDKRVFDGSIVRTLLEWQEGEDRLAYKESERQAGLFHQVVAVVTKKDDRDMLAKLSIFRYFNEELVKEIYPEEATAIMKYMRVQKDFFFPTDHNIKIQDDIYRTIKDYTELIPLGYEDEYSEVIGNIWDKKREEVIAEMAEVEKNLEVDEASIAAVREELRQLLEKIHGHESNIRKRKQQSLKQAQSNKPKKKFDYRYALYKAQIAIGVTVEFLGILFLYLGILFADQLSYAYCGIGVFLILGGFFWPYKKRPPPQKAKAPAAKKAKATATKEAAPTPQSDKNLRLLNMELTNLENKRSVLSRNIAKQRRVLSGLDTLLSEPYI